MNKTKEFLKRNIDVIAAFFIPVVILSAVFLLNNVYPFGKFNIIKSDLYQQYMPIMMELKNAISDGGSILYSFNGGLGTDFYVLNAYQNASPLTLFFLFVFDSSHLVLAVTLMIMVKIGLISSAMYYYLKKAFPSDAGWDKAIRLLLGATFALSAYIIAYFYNVMWLDSIILLPLVVLGMRRTVDGLGGKLYTFSLALLLLTNFYMGGLMCLFLFFYFFVYFFGEEKRDFLRTFARVGLHSVFGILMSMVVLLPVFFAISKTDDFAGMGAGSSGLLYRSVARHVMQILPNSEMTPVIGPPNLYAGLIALILFFLFILDSRIGMRKRLIKALFVLFIFISTNVIPLDTALHFFHAPNGIPARYSIVLAFMLIEIAAETFDGGFSLPRPRVALAVFCVAAIYGVVILGVRPFYPRHFYLVISGVMLTMLFAFVFIFMRGPERNGKAYIAAIILFELMIVTFRGVGQAGIIEVDRFTDHRDEIKELVAVAEERNPHTRLEILGTDNFNAPYVYDYKGLSIFASSVPGNTFKILNTFYGYDLPQINKFMYRKPKREPDTRLNVGYYISFSERDEKWLKKIKRYGDCYLYENPNLTSIGYMTPGYDCLMEVDEMKGNRVSGRIDVNEGGTFMTSIPYDEGWEVEVDGRAKKTTRGEKYFISFPLGSGSHRIEMIFVPKGLTAGAILTLAGTLIYLIYEWLRRRKKHLQ